MQDNLVLCLHLACNFPIPTLKGTYDTMSLTFIYVAVRCDFQCHTKHSGQRSLEAGAILLHKHRLQRNGKNAAKPNCDQLKA